MYVYDAEILNIEIEHDVAELLNDRQFENVRQNMRMADAEKRVAIAEKLAEAEKAEQEIRSQQLLNKMALQREEALQKIAIQAEVNRKNEAEKLAAQQATNDLQPLLDAVNDAEIERLKKDRLAEIEHKKNLADIEKSKQMAYAEAVVKTLNAVQPGLIEALNAKANAQMLTSVSDGLAPYAMAKDESVADFINTLLRGTTLENVLTNITSSKE
jgi:hypothetical protein